LLSVAMACATVFESTHGTENALELFYKSWWFESLLVLLGLNVLSAMIVRYPFSKRHIGFVMTHCSILLVLVGALITQRLGVDGRLFIVEGQSEEAFTVAQETLALSSTSARSSIEIDRPRPTSTQPADMPGLPAVVTGSVRAEVVQYAPESRVLTDMVNDNPHPQLAVEVSFSASGIDEPEWIMAGQPGRVGEAVIACRQLTSDEELRRLTSTAPATQEAARGLVRIEYQGKTHDLPVDDLTATSQPVADTGLSLRVLRYLAEARVVGGQLTSVSNEPVNPAIEVELSGPQGSEKRFAFARVPDFQEMHGNVKNAEVKVNLVVPRIADQTAPIEILCGPGDAMHVRFSVRNQAAFVQELRPGVPIETPLPDRKLGVLRVFKNSRARQTVLPGQSGTGGATPAILVRLTSGQETTEAWVQKYRSQSVALAGQSYLLDYDDKSVPLGFKVTLDSFRVSNYPGSNRQRSYESRITINDPAAGREESRIISMNRPTSYGRYTFYQSSYRQMGQRHMASELSVSWDPGQPVVFAGYGLMMAGMLVVLVTRLKAKAGSPEQDESLDQ